MANSGTRASGHRWVRRAAPALLGLVAACAQLPDTVGETAPVATVWSLASVDGQPAEYGATLRLLSGGRVVGNGPCNRYSGEQTAPLPWIEFSDLTLTRRGCPVAEAEQSFVTALGAMDFAEITPTSLRLTNAAGQSLGFVAR